MHAKTMIGIGLLVFVAGTIGYMVVSETGGSKEDAQPTHAPETPTKTEPQSTATVSAPPGEAPTPEPSGGATLPQSPGKEDPSQPPEGEPTKQPSGSEIGSQHEEGGMAKVEASPQRTVTLYYFHGSRRCRSCRILEDQARDAVLEGFPEEIKAGTVLFQSVNFEESHNRQLVLDHQVSMLSLVVSETIGDQVQRYKVLDQMWQLSRNPDEYRAYVQREVRSTLNEEDL